MSFIYFDKCHRMAPLRMLCSITLHGPRRVVALVVFLGKNVVFCGKFHALLRTSLPLASKSKKPLNE